MAFLPKRHNLKWNINELNSLQREYELLELTPEEIAEKHQRTTLSILYKLREEGIIFDEARNGWYARKNGWNKSLTQYSEENDQDELSDSDDEQSESDDDQSEFDDDLSDDEDNDFRIDTDKRLTRLEEGLDDMKKMLSHILTKVSKNKSSYAH